MVTLTLQWQSNPLESGEALMRQWIASNQRIKPTPKCEFITYFETDCKFRQLSVYIDKRGKDDAIAHLPIESEKIPPKSIIHSRACVSIKRFTPPSVSYEIKPWQFIITRMNCVKQAVQLDVYIECQPNYVMMFPSWNANVPNTTQWNTIIRVLS